MEFAEILAWASAIFGTSLRIYAKRLRKKGL
jgi:hypothetical protein